MRPDMTTQLPGMPGYGTDAILGQRIGVRTWDAYAPRAYGPTLQGVPGYANAVPPIIGSTGVGPGVSGVLGANPHRTAILGVLALVVGVVGLRVIHWRHG